MPYLGIPTCFSNLLNCTDSLECYAPKADTTASAQGRLQAYRHACPTAARFLGLARCGHHDFLDGRSARHRNSMILHSCANGPDSLSHALLDGVAYSRQRRRLRLQTRRSNRLSLETLFSTDPAMNTACDILRNVVFVATICRDASACEM